MMLCRWFFQGPAEFPVEAIIRLIVGAISVIIITVIVVLIAIVALAMKKNKGKC